LAGLAIFVAECYSSRTIARSHDHTAEGPMPKPTIAQLVDILDSEEDTEIEILPNGEIRAKGGSTGQDLGGRKPVTMREQLGGEYAGPTRK